MNSLFGILASLITVALNFVVRIVLVRSLGAEINGLHNLFQNISSVMALMEMGVSTAIIIHLYEPVNNHDAVSIKAIMSFYRKLYNAIAAAFALVFLLVDLFLIDKLVTSTIAVNSVRLYFAIFSLSFLFDFLTYHKRSLLFAEQKNRISIGVTALCELVFRTAQIITVLVYHQYVIFLILMVAEKVTSNLICAIYVNHHHPYLKRYHGVQLEEDKKLAIKKTIKPLFINQMASTIQKSANSILVSILLGNVSIVGYYGNYQLVIGTAELLFSQFGGAFTSSFGNLAVERDKDRMYHAYRNTALVMNSVACVLCAGFIACIQDFIYVTFGPNYVLGIENVFILTGSMLMYLLSIPIVSIQNAMGLHDKDQVFMVIQAGLGIVLGYMLGSRIGMPGILTGLLMPMIIFTLLLKGRMIYNVVFDMRPIIYYKYILIELARTSLIIGIVWFVSQYLPSQSLLGFLVKGLTAILISVPMIILLLKNDPLFRDIKKSIMKRTKQKEREI